MTDHAHIAVRQQATFLWKQKFSLTPEAISREWTSLGGGNTGHETVRLESVSPNLSRQSAFGHHAMPSVSKGIILFLAALSIHFSAFNKDIPLLAPILFILALPFLIIGGSRMRQYDWTILENTKGERIFFIPHNGTAPGERARFEEVLGKTLENLHRQKEESHPDAGLDASIKGQ